MKKVILTLAVIAAVACMSSCNKKCTCTTKVNGEVQSTIEDIDITKNDNISKCKDMNSSVTILGQTTETKCKSQL
ncbi:MAG: hypothetical protein J6X62_05340 [Bacteroidales bacterium]|nr:hypothetical protein [Bacteroidales bacterium]